MQAPEPFQVEAPDRLDRLLKARCEASWNTVRGWVASGKVFLDGEVSLDGGAQPAAGARVEVRLNAPRPRAAARLDGAAIRHADGQVLVVFKPPGISTVPHDESETGTLVHLLREHLRQAGRRSSGGRGRRPGAGKAGAAAAARLEVVHRIDKGTSGLLVFARTVAAKKHLQQQFRVHSVERRYLALVAGHVRGGTIRSRLVQDRGDGRRGSTTNPRLGKDAVTHVEVLERLPRATLVACRLETGRTHQIRIHLSEAGHPLVGERVYDKGHDAVALTAPRIMLHAATLGFEHPARGEQLRFESPMPEDMGAVLASLRG